MRALVTGADGFIGGHLVEFLRDQGDEVATWTKQGGSPDVGNVDEVAEFLAGVDVDAVYHLAGQADVARSWQRPGETISVNAGGTANLFAALREAGSEARVLVMSSAEVYGDVRPEQLPLLETTSRCPQSPYGVSKLAAEEVALQAWRSTGQQAVICRPFNNIGPRQSANFVASAIARRIVENERAGQGRLLVGDLTASRDFVDVRDSVRAYRLVMERGTPGETYHVSTGTETVVQDLVDLLVSHSTIEQRLEVDPSLARPARLARLVGSPARLQQATGWTPNIPLSTTAKDILDDWRSRLDDSNQEQHS